MTVEEFFDRLQYHDWYYDYSDDHSVWQRGLADRADLKDLAKENDKFSIMFEDYAEYIYACISKGPHQEEVPRPALEDYV